MFVIVRKSWIGWNYCKSDLYQIVLRFLIGCHWQNLSCVFVARESSMRYEFLCHSCIQKRQKDCASVMPPEIVDCLFIQILWILSLIQYYVYFLYCVVLPQQAPVCWDWILDFGFSSSLARVSRILDWSQTCPDFCILFMYLDPLGCSVYGNREFCISHFIILLFLVRNWSPFIHKLQFLDLNRSRIFDFILLRKYHTGVLLSF